MTYTSLGHFMQSALTATHDFVAQNPAVDSRKLFELVSLCTFIASTAGAERARLNHPPQRGYVAKDCLSRLGMENDARLLLDETPALSPHALKELFANVATQAQSLGYHQGLETARALDKQKTTLRKNLRANPEASYNI